MYCKEVVCCVHNTYVCISIPNEHDFTIHCNCCAHHRPWAMVFGCCWNTISWHRLNSQVRWALPMLWYGYFDQALVWNAIEFEHHLLGQRTHVWCGVVVPSCCCLRLCVVIHAARPVIVNISAIAIGGWNRSLNGVMLFFAVWLSNVEDVEINQDIYLHSFVCRARAESEPSLDQHQHIEP